mgnify:CR=1 FL=1
MNKILLEITNLKKKYDHLNKSITLFDNFNINIKEGDLVAVVGPSGSGKSSLLHLLALLDDPSKGKIVLNNQETKNLSESDKNKLKQTIVSIIFQDNNLLTDFTAIENVMMPLIIRGENKTTVTEKAEKILNNVKIFNRSNHFPNELSGGEQQRVAIARSLINNPDLILADEMTGNLDENTAKEIFSFFIKYVKENKKSLIYVTHNNNFANKANNIFKFKNSNLILMK